ncbi:thioesterase [Streptomyces carminius]|uniref:Thioesterase n=1 Tax=Streptomyces carminius TaxID=2665496 RepID=A0A2M8M1W7_9ACTN|nr:alpha/beta fold hydrolase [Streptomyces carminius]PJE98192.1 thioesterase [Streptomyces carminius]
MTLSAAEAEQWIRRYRRPAPESRLGLVCFPHAGGSATYYSPVSAALDPSYEVMAIQYPGRQERRHTPCIDDIGELARQAHAALAGAGIGGPGRSVALFGHSMGATVAFEVALLMERDGTGPVVLFASGRRAPSRFREDNVHLRDDASIVEEIRALGGTDSRVLRDRELLEMVLPTLRSDYRAVERYRRGTDTRIGAPIVVLVGDSDPHATREEALAWRDHTTGHFEAHTFPGGHFYLEKQQEEVLGTVTEVLGRLHP